ncbi:hypothetical protein FACS189487_10720 [Campylobacterota bacterium]|nr:hypothetical protein FACS189487_10720 [Campylobacterota bacterium]
MQIDREILMQAYKLVSEFLDAVNRSDTDLLKSKFNISSAVYDEIIECLKGYFGDANIKISPPPLDTILENSHRLLFELSSDNDCLEIECLLYNNNIISEPIAHFYLLKDNNKFKLEYQYIGS